MNDPAYSPQCAPHLQALRSLLRREGIPLRSFVAEEDDALAACGLFGIAAVLLRVRCVASGRERTYSAGTVPGSAWLDAFRNDVAEGRFAPGGGRRRPVLTAVASAAPGRP